MNFRLTGYYTLCDIPFFCLCVNLQIDKWGIQNTTVAHWFHLKGDDMRKTNHTLLRIVPPSLYMIPDGICARELGHTATLVARCGHVYTTDPCVAQKAAELHNRKMH